MIEALFERRGGAAPHIGERDAQGSPLNWIAPWDELTPVDAAGRAGAGDVVEWMRIRGARSARELGERL